MSKDPAVSWEIPACTSMCIAAPLLQLWMGLSTSAILVFLAHMEDGTARAACTFWTEMIHKSYLSYHWREHDKLHTLGRGRGGKVGGGDWGDCTVKTDKCIYLLFWSIIYYHL